MKKEIVELAKKLISFKSTSDNLNEKHKIIDFVKDYFKEYSVVTKKIVFNNVPSLVVTFDGKKKQKIWMNSHIDVVPADSDKMFKAHEQSGKLYGRGSYDMKTAAAASIILMAELSKLDEKPSVGLMLVTDEEIGGKNGSEKLAGQGYLGDFLLCCEPTELDINCKAKGVLWLEMTATGKSCHGSMPWLGVNAIDKFYTEFEKVRKMFSNPLKMDDDSWQSTFSLNKIESGTAVNKVPETCKALVDIRYTKDFDVVKFLKKLKSKVDLDVKIVDKQPMIYTDENNKMLKQFISIAKKYNSKIKVKGSHGSADLRYFTSKGMAGTEFGPNGEGMHAADEYVDIDTVVTSYNVWKEFILSIS